MSRLLVVTVVLVSLSLTATGLANRKTLIDAAIREAKLQASLQSSRGSSSNRAANSLAAFKAAAPRLTAQGNARVLFEDMVRRAEKKIFSQQAALQASDTEARAEILAKELLHTPGSVLTEEETAQIYQESDCINFHTEPEVNCRDPTVRRYRTANGECNNLENPLFGAAERPFRRLIPPQYEDGVAQLRGTMQSMNLSILPHDPFLPPYPSARIVSGGIVLDRPVEEDQFSHILMQWGQWMDHDLDEVPVFDANDCPPGCTIETDRCVPIPVPTDDQTFATSFGDPTAGPVCHPFARSVPACDSSPPGQLGPREQINALTSWIDGSQVYGSSQELQDRLRNGSTAFMLTGDPIPSNGRPSLPRANQNDIDEGFVGCPSPLTPSECFIGGDIRVNEQISLTVFHTIFVREHNRIAAQLQSLNSAMSDDIVFKLAREIVAAEIQKITYQDYLPIILGQRFFDEIIKPYEAYDPRIDSAVPNGFATAAYRFGHSQIRPVLDRLDKNFQDISAGPLSLANAFFNPAQFVESEGTDPILRGLISKAVRTVDEFLNSILTTQLFGSFDLATLNVQRGRDHGIPPYMVWKKWATRTCGETSDFRNELTYIRLLQTYGSLDTVDLFVGGLAEEPVPGGMVGATFACIFANTFGAIRDGDRFYYENVKSDTNPDAFFTAEQRDEIEKASLSRIICDNSDNIDEIQPNAFRLDESRVSCSSSEIPSMDLSVFVEGAVPTPNTGMCAMRIQVTTRRIRGSVRFVSESRFLTGTETITANAEVENGRSSTCVPFLCPVPGRDVELRISTPNDRLCNELGRRRNNKLPSNNANIPFHVYEANIGTSHIGTTTGAYESVSACKSHNIDGLFYNCPFSEVQSDERLMHSLEDALAQKEMYNQPKEDKKEKLIGLLEEYVQELKEEEKPVKDDQSHLLSELEDALNS